MTGRAAAPRASTGTGSTPGLAYAGRSPVSPSRGTARDAQPLTRPAVVRARCLMTIAGGRRSGPGMRLRCSPVIAERHQRAILLGWTILLGGPPPSVSSERHPPILKCQERRQRERKTPSRSVVRVLTFLPNERCEVLVLP